MKPMKLNVGIVCFPYGGNGGLPAEHPGIRHWMLDAIPKMRADERIGKIAWWDHADTPITMTRNAAVLEAYKRDIDVLLMLDSDNLPDFHLGTGNVYESRYRNPKAKPFFPTSFDFLYQHYAKGPLLIGAPYCGPAPDRLVYVFKWQSGDEHHDRANDSDKLQQLSRTDAAGMGGIHECAAIATGCLMIDMRIFKFKDTDTGFLEPPWFYYEWEGNGSECEYCGSRYSHLHSEDGLPVSSFEHAKASTEDVTFTRDVSQTCQAVLGYNPVYCNWDAWAGHLKIDPVGMPIVMGSDTVNWKFKRAVRQQRNDEQMVVIGNGNGKP